MQLANTAQSTLLSTLAALAVIKRLPLSHFLRPHIISFQLLLFSYSSIPLHPPFPRFHKRQPVGFLHCSFQTSATVHRVSKNVPHLACYNIDTHEWILIFFGRNVTDKAGNQKTLYYATLSNLYFCTTWQNRETRKSHFHSVGLRYTQCTYALSS